jgi:glycolate oxidase
MLLPNIEISTAPEDLACYGFDASGLISNPGMVAWPRTTKDAARLMKYASEKGLKVVPRGAGSGMTAGAVPTEGAMVMSLEKMNRILEIDARNLNVTVEPGVINETLQHELEKEGFFYPPDPASMGFCTLGGNVAENAGGPRALKYGVTRDYVMQLEAVLPTGEAIATGVRTHKGVVGYDLTRLLVGSEGTLGVFTKIRLRFLPLPEAVTTLLVFFGDVEASGRAVSEITSARIIPRTLEFMDREAIAAVENYKPTGLPTEIEALLLIELDGHPQAIKQEAERVVEICRNQGAEVEMAADENARDRLWRSRRAVSPALHYLGLKKINEDIVVPRSRLPEMLGGLKRLSSESGIKIINFGHAGDGNIHVNIMVEKDDEERQKKALSLVKEMFQRVLDLGGTISGEHGVGLTKAEFIDMEIKKRELELMRGIKGLFDPDNVLNPGKIFKK